MSGFFHFTGAVAFLAVALAALTFGGMCVGIRKAIEDAKKDRDSADWWKDCDQ